MVESVENPHFLYSNSASWKLIASCTVGTFLEFFDYTLYGYFASSIGQHFFPSENPKLQLIATWAIFSIGFIIRPLGGMIFGNIADKFGRSKILPLTTILMALPTIFIGLLPTFQMIGWFAPMLLLLCRLIQGLAISAEYNGASIYILENKWRNNGFLAAFTPFSCGTGMLAASFLAYLFTRNTIGELHQWQWRLPFIIAGLLVGIVAWYLRRTMQETDAFKKLQQARAILPSPIKAIIKNNKLALATNIVCSAYMCSASYILLVYMATFLHQAFHVSLSTALLFTSVAAFLEANFSLFFGWVSDIVERKKMLLFASIAMIVATLGFALTPNLGITQLLIFLILFVILLAAFDGPLTIYLPELFPTNIRYSATATGYNIGGAVIGGLAPFAISVLLEYVHFPQLVLAVYLAGFSLLATYFITLHARQKKKLVALDKMSTINLKIICN